MLLAHDCTTPHLPWAYYSGLKMQSALEERGIITKTMLGNAVLMALRTQPLVDTTTEILLAEPQEWFTTEFCKWIDKVLENA